MRDQFLQDQSDAGMGRRPVKLVATPTQDSEHTDWEAEFQKRLVTNNGFIIKFNDLQLVRQIGHGATCVVHAGW